VRSRLLHTRRGRVGLILLGLGAVVGVLAWRAPNLDLIGRAFSEVEWAWVAVAIGFNLLSTSLRAVAWHIVVNQALPEPHPKHRHVFSAFCVGLFGNAVLPGRVGEIARVGVLSRHTAAKGGNWAPIFGSAFAHRLFDVPPTVGLVVYVLVAARIPQWAVPGVEIVLGLGGALLLASFVLVLLGRRQGHAPPEGLGRMKRIWHMTLRGLRVLHSPGPAVGAAVFQLLGWTTQLLAVYFAFAAFGIDEPIGAAALVLLVANVALAFPLWPGSVGLFQAAVALALIPYGVAYQHGFAFGIGLQAIEMSVGVGLGILYLAREGLSFAMLKQIPRVTPDSVEEDLEQPKRAGALRRGPLRIASRARERVQVASSRDSA
jgi:glycosyltransferase 2 family protein